MSNKLQWLALALLISVIVGLGLRETKDTPSSEPESTTAIKDPKVKSIEQPGLEDPDSDFSNPEVENQLTSQTLNNQLVSAVVSIEEHLEKNSEVLTDGKSNYDTEMESLIAKASDLQEGLVTVSTLNEVDLNKLAVLDIVQNALKTRLDWPEDKLKKVEQLSEVTGISIEDISSALEN